MKKIILIVVLLAVVLSGCAYKVREVEKRTGLVEVQVFYREQDWSNGWKPGDCAVPMLSTFYVSEADDFASYAAGWRLVRFEKCAGFALIGE